jgi:hypothetical protein
MGQDGDFIGAPLHPVRRSSIPIAYIRRDGCEMMVKSSGVIVPTTGATSIVEFELMKAD